MMRWSLHCNLPTKLKRDPSLKFMVGFASVSDFVGPAMIHSNTEKERLCVSLR